MAELLIVVAIIAVLVAVAIPVFNKQLEYSREAVDISTLRQAYSAGRIALMNEEYQNYNIGGGGPGAVKGIYEAYYDPSTGSLVKEKNSVPSGVMKAANASVNNTKVINDLPRKESGTGGIFDGINYNGIPIENAVVIVTFFDFHEGESQVQASFTS